MVPVQELMLKLIYYSLLYPLKLTKRSNKTAFCITDNLPESRRNRLEKGLSRGSALLRWRRDGAANPTTCAFKYKTMTSNDDVHDLRLWNEISGVKLGYMA